MVYDTVCDGIDLDFVEETGSDGEEAWLHSTRVKYFTHELSFRGRLKRLFLRKPTTRLGSRIVDLVLKVILCLLYVIRVELDDHLTYQCSGHSCSETNGTLPIDNDKMVFSSNAINWYVLVWVRRPLILWIIQVLLSFMTLSKSLLDIYIGSKGTCLHKLTHDGFILDLICTVPYLVTVAYPPLLSNIFIPSFLNCWLVRRSLQKLLNDLHLTRQRFQTISVTLSQQLLVLIVTLWCLIFTTICGIQHIQRGSNGHQLSMFEAMYFVIVTFSTVGYGDISPDTWLGQLFMTFMICLAFAFIPRQVEGITSTLKERKKVGGEYSQRHSEGHRHVVVCATNLTAESIMDFLIEFYAHPKLEDHIVVLLSSEERDTSLQMILKDPKWAHRVIYMRGSALKDIDLQRCRIHEADGCFILTPTVCNDRDEADQHTILRSWAVKDFAPKCRQYIQLFKTENKIHVKFADESRLQQHVVCEDEFKYALLANNCLYPGMSTLVTLLLHTTTGEAGLIGQEPWQQVYGRHSRNAVYHIQLCKSMFFRGYSGQSFTCASANAHKRFGVCLVAVLDITKPDPRLQLNPGANYKLKDSDYCFYIAEFKEEYAKICSEVKTDQKQSGNEPNKNLEQITELLEKLLEQDMNTPQDEQEESVFNNTITCQWGMEIARRMRTKSVPETRSSESDPNESGVDTEVDTHGQTDPAVPKVLQVYEDMGQESIITGPPPPTLYASKQKTLCHVMKSPRPVCCLEWGTDCEHCTYKNARDGRWTNQLIILAAEDACVGIHNFIVPLRSHFISMNSLSPIILLLNERPTNLFLETIGHFPFVYWIQGKITSIDDLILAGIHKVSHLVIVNHESKSKEMEKTMVDSESVVAVQTILKLFPNTNIITELSQASNIRFMQFQANNEYTRQVSKLERKLKERMSSTLSHIFRLPFAAGQVFSASMLNSLLYQTFVKGYLITFVRLLLGIDAEEDSGHLSSIRVKNMTLARYRTFGELYHGMATTTGEVPIAIYRTEKSGKAGEDETVNNNEDGKKNGPQEAHSRPSLPKGPFMGNHMENSDMSDLVRNRMESLGMDADDYEEDTKDDEISYVILNPTPKRKLRVGDIVYVVQPSSMEAIPHKQRWNRARSVRVKHKEHNEHVRTPRSTSPFSTTPRSTSPTSSSPGSSSPDDTKNTKDATEKEHSLRVNFAPPPYTAPAQSGKGRFTVVPSSEQMGKKRSNIDVN